MLKINIFKIRMVVLSILLLTAIAFVNCSRSSNNDFNVPTTDANPLPPPANGQNNLFTPPNTTNWTRYDKNLIINPAQFHMQPTNELGFDAADPCAIFDAKSSKWHMYFSSKIESLNVQVIKHAVSDDAATWTVQDSPALNLGATGAWDSKSVETCSILAIEKDGVVKYYLYYSGTNTLLGDNKDIYKMGLAISDDLNTFERISSAQSPKLTEGLVFDVLDSFKSNAAVVSGLVTDPKILYHGNQYLMWYYCAAKNKSGNFIDGGICYATSVDGIVWIHKGTLTSLLNTQTAGILPQQPTVIFNEAKKIFEMWVVIHDSAYDKLGVPGLAVGGYYHATSDNGINWIYPNDGKLDFNWDKTLESENNGLVTGPEVIMKDNFYYLFYPSFTSKGIPPSGYYPFTWGVNLATKKN